MPTTTLIGTNTLGADYATDTIDVRNWLLTNQARYVIRYIAGGGTWKHLTTPELEWLHANNIAVLLNHEGSATDAMKGEAGGRTNGTKTRLVAETLGYPKDCPLFVSVDQDIYSANRVVAEAYVRGFAATCGYPLGVYGDDDICAAVDDLNPVVWLPNASGWTGTLDPRVQIAIRQRRALYPPGVDPNLTAAPVTAWLPVPDPVPGDVPEEQMRINPDPVIADTRVSGKLTVRPEPYTIDVPGATIRARGRIEVRDTSGAGYVSFNGGRSAAGNWEPDHYEGGPWAADVVNGQVSLTVHGQLGASCHVIVSATEIG